MNKIEVSLKQNSYPIALLDNFSQLSELDYLLSKYNKVIVVTDDNVEKLYIEDIKDYYKGKNVELFSYVVKHGEEAKCIGNVYKICSFMAQKEFHRNDLLIALGGGVVGDLSGLVASLYMRGIDFIQIPTTLLAAVDASIGGKTAIDIPEGKNLVGTFYQPKAVIEIQSILDELNDDIFQEGISEVIKYGAIQDPTILSLCEEGIKDNLREIVHRCIAVKADVVSKDEKEAGLRKILNFGHTYAHAIEQNSHYKTSHGVAVAYGIIFEAFLSYNANHCSKDFYKQLVNLVNSNFELSKLPYSSDELVDAMGKDKKNDDEKISFVIPNGQENKILKLTKEEVKQAIESFGK